MLKKIKIFTLLCCFAVCGVALSSCKDPKFAKAEKFYKETEYDKAIAVYDEILRENNSGRNAEVYKLIGDVYFTKGDYNRAFENYKKSVEIDPQFAAQTLVSFISYGDQGLRHHAADTISNLSNNRDAIIEMFTNDIEQVSQYDKLDRLEALIRMRERAAFAAPKIIPLLNDANWGVRRKAVETITAMGPETMRYDTLNAIIGRLGDENDFVREEAARRLSEWGPHAEPAVPALISLLADNSEMVRNAADDAVNSIGKARREQVPELIQLLNDRPDHIVNKTLEVLERMGPDANGAVAAIIPLLKSNNRDISVLASHALMMIGRASEDTIPSIISLATDADENVRARVAYELGDVENYSDEVMNALLKMKNDKSPQVKASAETAIKKLESKK
jgi:HEAT repeat protein